MLNDKNAVANLAVRNLKTARTFYAETLGLNVEEQMGGLAVHLGGGADTFIYPKDDHVPATFTVLNFLVDDVEAAVDRLTEAGIGFEQYGGEIATDEKGIARGPENGPAIAWFKDPDGNILNVTNH